MNPVLPFSGKINVEGSKSIIQRVLLIGSMMENGIKIRNFSHCDDVANMLQLVHESGCSVQMDTGVIEVSPPAHYPYQKEYRIQASATALRFWLARCSMNIHTISHIHAAEQLSLRPVKPLIQTLRALGADITGEKFPYRIAGRSLIGGDLEVQSSISSQFLSAILLISPYLQRGLRMQWKSPLVSQGYVDMTIQIMRDFGIRVFQYEREIRVPAGQIYKFNGIYEVEPDLSSAANFAALGALSENGILIPFKRLQSIQPDFRIFSILVRMGASVQYLPEGYLVKHASLRGLNLDMSGNPDLVPLLSVLALLAESPSILRNVHHLRHKESDRIQGLVEELSAIGASIRYEEGHLHIQPLQSNPAARVLRTYQDHRFVMAYTILSLVFPQLKIDESKPVTKSYPKFFEELQLLKQ